MEIVWNYKASRLQVIEIKSPSTAVDYDPIIDTSNATSPYSTGTINTDLSPGVSTIRLTFGKDMVGISLAVTFNTNYGADVLIYVLTIVA